MNYYHLRLTDDSSKICTIAIPIGKYKYLNLLMGVCNSMGIFYKKNKIIIMKYYWYCNLDILDMTLEKTHEVDIIYNIDKSFFLKQN